MASIFYKLSTAIEVGDLKKTKKLLRKYESNAEEIVNIFEPFYKRTLLHFAAINGHLEIIEVLHQKGADLSAKSGLNSRTLNYAAINGHIDVLAYLLDQELDINQRGESSCTPLMNAAMNGQFHVVKYLFERGANFNLKDAEGNKAIHLAASYGQKEIVEFILNKAGGSANDRGFKNKTPLHCASISGNVELVASLVERGGDMTCKSVDGEMPIHSAAMNGHVDVLRFFRNYKPHLSDRLFNFLRFGVGGDGNSVHTLGENKFTPLHYASYNGELEAVRFLVCEEADVHAKSRLGYKPVHTAAERGHLHVVEFFLSNCGIDANDKNSAGYSLLYLAAKYGHLKLVKELLLRGADAEMYGEVNTIHIAAQYGNCWVIEQFLEHGVDINFRIFGLTPLHQAAAYGDLKTVQFLVDRGADVNARTPRDNTALKLAKQEKNEKVIQFLEGWPIESYTLHLAVLNGNIKIAQSHIHENVDDVDSKGYTPLFYAAKSGNVDIVELLISENANPFVEHGDRKYTALHLAAYSNSSEVINVLADAMKKLKMFEVDVKDIEGNTPLIWAVERGNVKAAQALIDLNANVNLKNKGGLTSLHIAAENGHLPLITLILSSNGKIDAADYVCGRKPIHLAAKGGHTEVLKYLLSCGTGIEEHDEKENTPLHYAADFGRCELVKYLVEIGVDAGKAYHQRPFDTSIFFCNRWDHQRPFDTSIFSCNRRDHQRPFDTSIFFCNRGDVGYCGPIKLLLGESENN